jgi:hypothetical protein
LYILALRRQLHQPLLVPAQSQPLVQQAVFLSFQLPCGPVIFDRFDFVEGSGLGFYPRAAGFGSGSMRSLD